MNISDLNDIIREVMDERELADPRSLMPFVLERITHRDRRDALALCLPIQIQRVIRARRTASYRLTPTLNEQVRLLDERPGFYIDEVEEWIRAIGEAGLLEQRVRVKSEWKFLGDCTSAELRELASTNRENAARNLSRAKFYSDLADTLDRHRIRTLVEYRSAAVV